MILQEIKAGQEQAIFPLIDERIEEAGIRSRIDPDYAKLLITQNLFGKGIEVFTDDIAKPNCALVMSYGRLSILTEECAIISFIHVSKALREKDVVASLTLGKTMLKVAELQARNHRCHSLRGTSLVWRGGPDISSFFEAHEFELQSHEYVKLLNHNGHEL